MQTELLPKANTVSAMLLQTADRALREAGAIAELLGNRGPALPVQLRRTYRVLVGILVLSSDQMRDEADRVAEVSARLLRREPTGDMVSALRRSFGLVEQVKHLLAASLAPLDAVAVGDA